MNSERRFFSGNTLAQALSQAAQHYQVEPEALSYTQIEKRHGFLRSRKKVVIEVHGEAGEESAPVAETSTDSREQPAESQTTASDRPVEPEPDPAPEAAGGSTPEPEPDPAEVAAPSSETPSEGETSERSATPKRRDGRKGRDLVELQHAPMAASDRFPEAEGDDAAALGQAIDKLLSVGSLDLEYKILQGDERFEVEMWGADQDILLRDRGRLLLALQHLLPRVTRGIVGHSVVCRVDSDSFQEIREERLRDMAQRAADDVRSNGRPKKLEPMSPDERRIVHITLADYPGVDTESQGSGLFKRVMVRPER